jgi:hypothetical protein
MLIAHFGSREPPLSFTAPERIASLLVDAERRFPAWRSRLLAKVQEERRQGLSVYDRRSGPLAPGFDWSSGAGGSLDDRLYDARPHRFGFLPRWALACHYDSELVAELDAVLASWMALAGEPGGHPGFRSSHVVVYHFIALLLAWPFVAALDQPRDNTALISLKRRALQILYEGSHFMRAVNGSGVANNHLLAERLADWLTAVLLPEFEHAPTREVAEAAWLDELHRQTYDDGGSFEHSVHYQEHACELAVIYLLLSRRNGWPIPEGTLNRIERMLQFQLAMAGPALLPLPIGNTTEDPLLPLGVAEGWQSGFLREIQRAYFGSEGPPAPDDDPTRETAFWLLEGALADTHGKAPGEAAFQDFPDSGFAVLADPENLARLVFRLGPAPGVAAIGGHSHCDLLSLTLSVDDTMVLAPPGTGSYRLRPRTDLPGQPNLRACFASASCRSGFFIEGFEPYGRLKGDFRNWRLPCQVTARRLSAAASGLSWVEGAVVGEGAYVGQCRGVVHVWGHGWLVYDRPPLLQPSQRAAIGWQFAPGVTCRPTGDGLVVAEAARLAVPFHLLHCGTNEPSIVIGEGKPFRGWVSPSYGRLEPAANLRFPLAGGGPGAAFFLTLNKVAGQRLVQVIDDDNSLGFRLIEQQTAPRGETLLLLSTAEWPAALRWGDVVFHGRLLYLRREGQDIYLRALALTQLLAPSWNIDLKAHEPSDFELLIVGGEAHWPRGHCRGLEGGSLP